MPLWSVQEWRARIGTSWCALGRPISSKSSYRGRGNYLRSPPPGGGGGGSGRRRGAASCAHHGAVTVVIMIALLLGTILTLLHFVLGGHRLIDACWFVCTPVDLLLVQWMLAMSLVTNGVSRLFSRSWSLLCCSDSTDSFLSGFEAFPISDRVAILFDMEKSKRTDTQVARGSILRNFWQTFYGKMKSIRLSLVSAVVKVSLLLRCGDVETNPGPDGKLDQVIDSEHGGVPRHLGQIADAMYEWEGSIAEQLELTQVDVVAIKTQHPARLKLQTRAVLEMWKQRHGYKATYNNLISVFERAGYQYYADVVKQLISDSVPRMERYFLVGEKLMMETIKTGQTYLWLKDGNLIENDQKYDGVNTPKLTVKHALSRSAGTYTCLVDGNKDVKFRQILTTSEEVRRAIEKYGEVTLHIAKVLVTGGGGSGKTCTKAILYGKVPPTEHISSDLLEGVPTYCECEKLYLPKGDEFGKWTPAELTDILVMLRNGIMSKMKLEPRGLHSAVVDEDNEDEDDGDDESNLDLGQTGSELLKKINEEGFGGRNIAEFYWVYFFDSAGQSEYLDIIPAFIENVTVTMYVLDLTKPLCRNLTDNLGIKGETGPVKDEKFTLKGEQVLQAVLQTLRFQGELEKSKLMVVGTHRDIIEQSDDQTVPQRNAEVREIIDSTKCESENFEVISNGEKIIFELSAIENPTPAQDQSNKKTAKNIRRIVSKECSKEVNIPTTWFLCEEDLRKKGEILTIEECIPVAEQNEIDPEDELKKMLKLFHKLNIFFYYSEDDDLKDTIFTSPHIIMKLVSEIVKDARKSHSAEGSAKSHSAEDPKRDPIRLTTRKTISKHSLGIVVKRTCKQIDSKHLEKLIKLLEKRLILVEFLSDPCDEYYMPCIFPVCENPCEVIKKKYLPNQVKPNRAVEQKLVHTSLLIELKGGCAPRGIFNGLVCHFLRHRDAELELIHDSSDLGLYRNFIHGNYRQNSSFQVSLVNSFHYFEAHVIGPRYDEDICEKIRKCLKNGLEAAYKQFYREQDVPAPVQFLCSATEDCLKSPHMAKFPEVGTSRELICSRDKEVTYKLDPKHLVWLNEEERKHACGNTPAIEPKEDDPVSDLNVDRGGVIELSVKCNDADLEYQWQHVTDGDSTDIRNNPHYKVDKSNLTIRNAQEKHAGYYHCEVTNLAGCSVSGYFHVIVLQVPSAPPSDLVITRKDSSSVTLSWKPPPKENHNGQLIGYTVEVKDVNGVPQQASKQPANSFITIDGLTSDTEYVFHVSARTAAGSGPDATVSGCADKGDERQKRKRTSVTAPLHHTESASEGSISKKSRMDTCPVTDKSSQHHKTYSESVRKGCGGGESAHDSSGAASAANTMSDNPPTLPTMLRILLPASKQWMNIGIMLSLSHGHLTAIDTRWKGVPDDCLREMLNDWLQQDNPPPTKSALVDAVEMYNPPLAEKISAL